MNTLNPLDSIRILCGQMLERATARLAQKHETSLRHLRNAELELLRGIRAFAEEELRFLDQLIERREEAQKPQADHAADSSMPCNSRI